MRIGYIRISKSDQNPDLQFDAINKEDCDKILIDKASGTIEARPDTWTQEVIFIGSNLVTQNSQCPLTSQLLEVGV